MRRFSRRLAGPALRWLPPAAPAARQLAVAPEPSAALAAAVAQIESMYGAGALMQLGDRQPGLLPEDVVPTGSVRLDEALGIGGLPRGRVVEIYGPESSGKTTLALHAIAEAQKLGGRCTFIDVEHALDTAYAEALGADVGELYISQPQSGEQALEICDTLVRSGSMDIVVIDSVAALVPRAELEGEMGDVHMGLQARLMSQALRKLTASLAGSRTTIIFLNQLRQKIGVMFGNPEVTAGGQALKYYASVRLEIRRQIPKNAMAAGHGSSSAPDSNSVLVKVVKNKCAPPFRQASFDINFGTGICHIGELIDVGVERGVIEKRSSWLQIGAVDASEEPISVQGTAKLKALLEDDEALLAALEARILDPEGEADDAAAGGDGEDAGVSGDTAKA